MTNGSWLSSSLILSANIRRHSQNLDFRYALLHRQAIFYLRQNQSLPTHNGNALKSRIIYQVGGGKRKKASMQTLCTYVCMVEMGWHT